MESQKNITLIGAGLVGSLLSQYLAKRGHKVSIFEKRSDMRKAGYVGGRSINLALSHRGFNSLRAMGLEEEIRKVGIPMYGRVIHQINGDVQYQAYGKEEDAIYSVSRGGLNKRLMELADENPNISIHFDERCFDVDVQNATCHFENMNTKEHTAVKADLVLSADGAFSAARLALQTKTDRFEYSQHYLDQGYKELTIPAGPNGEFLLEKNALHIWPRNQFMLIALPNLDGSFTCTLFFPFEGNPSFASLQTEAQVREFLTREFPNVVALSPDVVNEYMANPNGSLVTVKCFPWVFKDKLGLMGDASHAIVPFFGQGMNSGFEDCFEFGKLMDKHGDNWEALLAEFQDIRKINADAIADMAVENFIEMRDKVADQKFLLRKKIEAKLNKIFPDHYVSKYSLVSFSTKPYSYALEMGFRQDALFEKVLAIPEIENNWDSDETFTKLEVLLKEFQFLN
jgi:kynurenine 3-monooxygenase